MTVVVTTTSGSRKEISHASLFEFVTVKELFLTKCNALHGENDQKGSAPHLKIKTSLKEI